ncbi:uncharacterized protein LOC21398313 [Morus notabilis]|uniref:uncharacterized protein LOC21398313 n=1 Tax=Morus notabilis TaxID=981085 RepID=UPI000CED43FE|nr:uncharacterized protein LOC21398313 [Morus notabilis]
MADYVASTSCINLYMQIAGVVKHKGFKPQTSHFRTVQRKYFYGICNSIGSPRRKMCELTAPGISKLKVSPQSGRSTLKCMCFGSLVNSEGATASNWVPVVDQVLLMASIFLTYMAGVIPVKQSYQKDISSENRIPESSTSSGSSMTNEEQANPKYALDVVKEKLLDSLDAFERGANLGSRILEYNESRSKRPLHLSAVADGPRLRLLWAILQQIEEEVNGISNSEYLDMYDRLTVFSRVIRKSCLPVCMTWLEREHRLANSNLDKALVSLLRAKLNGDDTVLLNIKNSGKEDLYADLLCFLCFGSISRADCCYNKSLYFSNGVSILEDFLINLAEGVASIYLELISVDSNVSNEMNSLCLALCTLSTRELQRLRNEVALNQWLYQNLESVASMYEDRFDLCTLQRQLIGEPANSRSEKPWWKKLTWRKSNSASSPSCYVVISQFSMPVKRTNELRALTGWRYYFSLFLELSDIGMPFIRAIINKVSDMISFFLVSLIGRSLGLIYTGIRQSLRWK